MKQLAPLNFLRVYYQQVVDSIICISEIRSVVNSDYEETITPIGDCEIIHWAVADTTIDTTDTTVVIHPIDMYREAEVRAIPNPSKGTFDVYVTGVSLQGADLSLTNALGEVVYENKQLNVLSNYYRVAMETLPTGLYQLHIRGSNYKALKRILIEH